MATVKEEWGMACPACGRDDRLQVQVTTWAGLSADGTDADCCPHEWDKASACLCDACAWQGTVADASDGSDK